ncbi:MAG: tRNA (adenosine(37)-N6)-threonylcarbamoyltransferase complex ATPase subunit type 1 TsaE [Alphaproteobacteria bacterium]|nr:tRNA (adenosine(37)-N6)-threonylcarbamoyltransferase complex ATPase subunit type 1 TsaE [Alphaproteobacteria bacterium]
MTLAHVLEHGGQFLDLDEEALIALANQWADQTTRPRAPWVILLEGALAAGKSTFARAYIRQLMGEPQLHVASPTFTLMNVYDAREWAIYHLDLYRVAGTPVDDLLDELLDDVAMPAVILIEWAPQTQDWLTRPLFRGGACFRVGLSVADDNGVRRNVTITPLHVP